MAHTPSLPTGSGAPTVVPTAASTTSTSAATPVDPEIDALEMQIAAAKERQQRNNRMTLIVIALMAIVSIVIGVVNWAMQGFDHAEKMACMKLKETQPNAECSYSTSSAGSNNFKPAYVSPTMEQAPARPSQVETPAKDKIPTHRLNRDNYKVPDLSVDVPQRSICADGVDINAYPTGDAYYVGGKSIDGGGIIIKNGECVLLKLKGGGS